MKSKHKFYRYELPSGIILSRKPLDKNHLEKLAAGMQLEAAEREAEQQKAEAIAVLAAKPLEELEQWADPTRAALLQKISAMPTTQLKQLVDAKPTPIDASPKLEMK